MIMIMNMTIFILFITDVLIMINHIHINKMKRNEKTKANKVLKSFIDFLLAFEPF